MVQQVRHHSAGAIFGGVRAGPAPVRSSGFTGSRGAIHTQSGRHRVRSKHSKLTAIAQAIVSVQTVNLR